MSQREKFEQWAKEDFHDDFQRTVNDTRYCSLEMEARFQGWQAGMAEGIKLTKEAAANICAESKLGHVRIMADLIRSLTPEEVLK